MPKWEATPEQESAVREGYAARMSLGDLAKQLGVTKGDLSRWCRKQGILWSTEATSSATEVRRQQLAAARDALAEQLIADAVVLRERLWEECTVWMPGINGPKEIRMAEPDAKGVADISRALEALVRSAENLQRMGGGSLLVEGAKEGLARLAEDLGRVLRGAPPVPTTADDDGAPEPTTDGD